MGVNGIYGLSGSGIDVESMVKVGMMSKQKEYDKMAQKYTKNEWTKAEYLKLNSSITTFNMSTLSQYKMSATMNAKEAESSSAAIKVSANATAAVMSHKVQVDELSSNAYLIGVEGVTRKNVSEPTSIKLSDALFLVDENNVDDDGNIVKQSGIVQDGDDPDSVKVTYGTADDSTEATFKKTDIAFKFVLSDGTGDDANKATISFTYGELLNGATFNDLVSKINNANTNVKATYDSVNDRFSFYNREGGKDNQIIFSLVEDEDDVDDEIAMTNAADFLSGLNLVQSRDGSIYSDAIALDDNDEPYVAATYAYDMKTGIYTDEATGITYESKYDSETDTETRIFTNTKTGVYYTYDVDSDTGIYTNANGITYDPDTEIYTAPNGIIYDVNAGTYTDADADMTYDVATGIYTDTNGITYNEKTKIYTDPNTGIYFNANTGMYYTADNEVYSPESDEYIGPVPFETFEPFERFEPFETFEIPTALPGGALQVSFGGSMSAAGTNGSITVDGISYETTDNKVNAGGITYTATAKTDSVETVTVTQDVDSIVAKVKSFIEDYNKLLTGLYEKYDEKPETGYAPLTQSQKDAMKEEQITKWEEKAQKGLLYHDKTLGKIINEMRESISTPIENGGKYNSAYAIGISTTGLKGQLTLNEDKLRAALADDSDAVYNVFAKLDTSQKDKTGAVVDNPEGNGIAQRLGDILTTATKNIKSRAGSTADVTEDSDLNTLLRQLQTKMSNFKKMMSSFETALYKKYDNMESTLAKLGTQLNFIMGGNQ